MKNKQSGSVLTIALVLVSAVSIFALAASGIVRNDFVATKKYKNSIKAGFLARSGIEKAIQVLRHDVNNIDSLNEKWRNNITSFKDVNIDGGYYTVSYLRKDQKKFGIVDEESKVNINFANEKMLLLLPGLGTDEVKRIIGSRNQFRFNRPSELVTRNVISSEMYSTIKELITVWGDGRINVNTASREVLSTVPNLYTNEIDAILDFRNGPDGIEGTSDDKVFNSLIDLNSLSGIQFTESQAFFKVQSNNFYVISEGIINNKSLTKGKKVINAVIERKQNKIKIQYWEMI